MGFWPTTWTGGWRWAEEPAVDGAGWIADSFATMPIRAAATTSAYVTGFFRSK
jgi:hypothetical protein